MLGFTLLGLVWFVGKPLTAAIARNEDPQAIAQTVQSTFDSKVDNSSVDTEFLDMQATIMSAADEAGRRFYGSTLLPLISLPIPRFLWEQKPALNFHLMAIATGARDVGRMGLTPNLSGESYLNFGWVGCFCIPALYMGLLQIGFNLTKNRGIHSAGRWLFMVCLITMVQVYRDGLTSSIVFPTLYFGPMFFWGITSEILYKLQSRPQPAEAVTVS
jgi:hypothetical protein